MSTWNDDYHPTAGAQLDDFARLADTWRVQVEALASALRGMQAHPFSAPIGSEIAAARTILDDATTQVGGAIAHARHGLKKAARATS